MNDVAKSGPRELSAEVKEWGVAADIQQHEIEIPRALVMQKTSKMLDKDPEARFGDIRDSIDGHKLGGAEPVEAIIFKHESVWFITTQNQPGVPREFIRSEPVTPENANAEWEFEEDGKKLQRSQYFQFYFLFVPEIDGTPYVLSCGRTSFKSGRKLVTQFARLGQQGKVSAAVHTNITTRKEEGDQGSYVVLDFAFGKASTPEEIETAKYWYFRMKKGDVKVAPEHEAADAPAQEDPTAGVHQAQSMEEVETLVNAKRQAAKKGKGKQADLADDDIPF